MPKTPKPRVIASWIVHFYTALGLAAGLLALLAASEGRFRAAMLYLTLACFIDSSDGTLARWIDVSRWTPAFDGRKLDDITDYLNYVMIPVFMMHRFELVTAPWTPVLFLAIIASGYGFCNASAKTEDGFFTGFPSYWNVVVLYQYLLGWPTVVNALAVLVLSVLVFVPTRYIYPSKTKQHQALTLTLSILWGGAMLYLVIRIESPPVPLVYASLLYVLYYMGLSFRLHFRLPREPAQLP